MTSNKRISLQESTKRIGTEKQCRQYLFEQHRPEGFVCPKCGARMGYQLSDGTLQYAACRSQASIIAGAVLPRNHLPLTKWFEALYFVSQDKSGISAVELQVRPGVTYKTAWYMFSRIRWDMGQRDNPHKLNGTTAFADAFFGDSTAGKKRGRGTGKAKVFAALSLDNNGKSPIPQNEDYEGYPPTVRQILCTSLRSPERWSLQLCACPRRLNAIRTTIFSERDVALAAHCKQ